MKKLTIISLVVILIVVGVVGVVNQNEYGDSETLLPHDPFLIPAQKFQINPTVEYDKKFIMNSTLFQGFGIEGTHFARTDENIENWEYVDIFPISEVDETFDNVGVKTSPQNTIVIYPLFTASAYSSDGFYDYYNELCDKSCLTVPLQESFIPSASGSGVQVLKLLGYDVITDLEFAKNPNMIKDFDKIILLHNEYVTKEMFDSITNHPKVLYLYPNVLHAEVKLNENDSITLIRGHGFNGAYNGFEWEFDNTEMEYNTECYNWEFYEIDNGMMLNCYPELVIFNDEKLLEFIKKF